MKVTKENAVNTMAIDRQSKKSAGSNQKELNINKYVEQDHQDLPRTHVSRIPNDTKTLFKHNSIARIDTCDNSLT